MAVLPIDYALMAGAASEIGNIKSPLTEPI